MMPLQLLVEPSTMAPVGASRKIRAFRAAPTYAMVEGSTNICKFIMAQDQLGIRKANR